MRSTGLFRRINLSLLLIIVLIEGGRLIYAPGQLDDGNLNLIFSLEWQVSLGILWAGIAGFGIIGVLCGWVWGEKYTPLIPIAFMIYTGLRVFIFAKADYDRQRLPFLFACITCSVLGMFVAWIINTRRQPRINTGETE